MERLVPEATANNASLDLQDCLVTNYNRSFAQRTADMD